MRKPVVSALGIALLVAASWRGNAAQEKSPPQTAQPQAHESADKRERAFGTIVSVGVDRFEINKADGSTQTVKVDEQTRYRQAQQEIQLEDLKAGDHVVVRGRTNANKEFVAILVRRITDEEMQRFQESGERAFGEIVSIEGNQIKVRNPWQGERTIVVNDQTQFTKEGQAITLKDLKVGTASLPSGRKLKASSWPRGSSLANSEATVSVQPTSSNEGSEECRLPPRQCVTAGSLPRSGCSIPAQTQLFRHYWVNIDVTATPWKDFLDC